MEILKENRLILGSGSPRRSQLLTEAKIPFEQIAFDVDEIIPPGLSPTESVVYLSRLKASSYKDKMTKKDILLTADTVVICDGKIMGKPKDRTQAKEMLLLFSGRQHNVATGICLTSHDKTITDYAESKVEFEPLDSEEIDYYIDNFHPYDKAGGYGIQDWIGHCKIKSIQGSYLNIMGLPIHLVYKHLKNWH